MNHERIERLARAERLLVGQRPRRKRPPWSGCRRRCRRGPTIAGAWTSCGTLWGMTARSATGRRWTRDPRSPAGAGESVAAGEARRRGAGHAAAGARATGSDRVRQRSRGRNPGLDPWASAHGVHFDFIRPGRPVESACIESFNGKLRDECLNQHHFLTLAEAQQHIETWRQEYNDERPHRGLVDGDGRTRGNPAGRGRHVRRRRGVHHGRGAPNGRLPGSHPDRGTRARTAGGLPRADSCAGDRRWLTWRPDVTPSSHL